MSILSDWARDSNFALSPETKRAALASEATQETPKRPSGQKPPPIIGTGIDYGSFTGRGGGGARFFGEGIVRLRSGSTSTPSPFSVSNPRRIGSSTRVIVQPGTLNGMVAENYIEALEPGLVISGNGFVMLNVNSDGKRITSFNISFKAGAAAPAPAQPTTPLAPMLFSWPIAWIAGTRTRTLIGPSSLVAVIRETSRIPQVSTSPTEPGYVIYYTWIISNSVEPTFVSLTGQLP